MKLKKLPFFLIVFLLISSGSKLFAQANDVRIKNIESALPVIDDLFAKYSIQNHLPGMVYGLVVDGKLIHTGNSGYLSTSQKNEANSKSAFRIASMTKSLTAMAILKLRDDGKLKLDDPVSLYIPEMKGQKYLTADAPEMSIRHLLTHAGGLPEDNPWGDRQLAAKEDELTDLMKKGISFSKTPGLGFEYSNLGYAALGYIIKKVSGRPYQSYITTTILEPLGMTHTYWEYSKVPPKDLAHGYRYLNERWIEEPLLHDGAYGAMGGLITSIEDFSKYVTLHLSAWPPRDEEDKGPIKRSSLREMQVPWNIIGFNSQFKYPGGGRACPLVFSYGYGLISTKDCNGRVFTEHSGGLPGFGSDWKMMPDYGVGIISFSNLTYASMGEINMQALDTLISIGKLERRQLPVSAILRQRKEELISLLPEWKNPEATNIFADNFFLDYFPDSLRKEAVGIFKKAGKIIRINELSPANNLRGSFIMEGENNDIVVGFTLTPENPPLIQEYRIRERKKIK